MHIDEDDDQCLVTMTITGTFFFVGGVGWQVCHFIVNLSTVSKGIFKGKTEDDPQEW